MILLFNGVAGRNTTSLFKDKDWFWVGGNLYVKSSLGDPNTIYTPVTASYTTGDAVDGQHYRLKNNGSSGLM